MFHRSVPDLYAQKLVEENVLDAKEIEDIKTQYNKFLNDELESTSTYTQKVNISLGTYKPKLVSQLGISPYF